MQIEEDGLAEVRGPEDVPESKRVTMSGIHVDPAGVAGATQASARVRFSCVAYSFECFREVGLG